MTSKRNNVHLASASELDVGLGTRMLLRTGGLKADIKSELIGVSRNEFLIVKAPVIPGMRTLFAGGENVVVRYLSEGTIFGFHSTMLQSQLKPVPLLFLEYPYQVEKIELRKEKRTQCALPSKVHSKDGIYPAVTVDLSIGGAKLDLTLDALDAEQLCLNEMVILEFVLFQSEKPVLLSCQIKNISAVKQRYTLGLQFDKLDEEARMELQEYIQSLTGRE